MTESQKRLVDKALRFEERYGQGTPILLEITESRREAIDLAHQGVIKFTAQDWFVLTSEGRESVRPNVSAGEGPSSL